MAKRRIFSGVGTALVTPFKNGDIDYTALGELIEMQIDSGIDALIIGGTTGEVSTLSFNERYQLYSYSKRVVNGRTPIIFGVGSNDTRLAIEYVRMASDIGCDGALVVTPYYNRGTDDGIVDHFLAIAEESPVPVLLYNVPTRTGVNLKIEAIRRLTKHQNIVGIKEAMDSAERLIELRSFGESLDLYAGNDSAFYEVLSLGGAGVISVISNAYPKDVKMIYDLFISGNTKGALSEEIRLLPLIKSAFIETNPAPIKYMLFKMGLIKNELRLPLSPLSEKSAIIIDEATSKRG